MISPLKSLFDRYLVGSYLLKYSKKEPCFKTGFLFVGYYLQQFGLWMLFSQPQSPTLGGKNSSVGNSIRRNISQGLSEVVVHSFSGIQKS